MVCNGAKLETFEVLKTSKVFLCVGDVPRQRAGTGACPYISPLAGGDARAPRGEHKGRPYKKMVIWPPLGAPRAAAAVWVPVTRADREGR